MRSTRFGVRDENVSQAPDTRLMANKAGQAAAVQKPQRNPLAEIRRQPLRRAAPAADKENRENAGECMEVDEVEHLQPLQLQATVAAAAAATAAERDQALLVKYNEIRDVDAVGNDYHDAQLVSCYVKEIFSYMLTLEPMQQVRRDYLCQPSRLEITPRMHRILFDWLVQVHQRYNLLPETLYMALHIIDYYMTLDGQDVSKDNYQLLGITAMFLAAKYEQDIHPLGLQDFVELIRGSCSEAQVRSMERKLLVRMDFFFGYPQPILFLRRYSRVSGATAEVHDSAKFLAELGRCNYDLVHLPPSGLAAAAFCLAVELLAAGNRLDTEPKSWLPELEVFSGYTKADLLPAMRLLAKAILQAYGDRQRYNAVRMKYGTRSFQMVSSYPEFSDLSNPILLNYAGTA